MEPWRQDQPDPAGRLGEDLTRRRLAARSRARVRMVAAIGPAWQDNAVQRTDCERCPRSHVRGRIMEAVDGLKVQSDNRGADYGATWVWEPCDHHNDRASGEPGRLTAPGGKRTADAHLLLLADDGLDT